VRVLATKLMFENNLEMKTKSTPVRQNGEANNRFNDSSLVTLYTPMMSLRMNGSAYISAYKRSPAMLEMQSMGASPQLIISSSYDGMNSFSM
jgi:hypothetical protein